MATLNLFIDASDNALLLNASSAQNIAPSSLPFYFGDSPTLNIYLFNRLPIPPGPGVFPFIGIVPAGLTLYVFMTDGLEGTTNIYAQQLVWVADPTNTFFTGTLALNLMALQNLFTTNMQAKVYLQIGYLVGAVVTTVFNQPVLVGVGLPNPATAPLPAGLTPLSLQVADQTFVPISGLPAGVGFYLLSPSGKKIYVQAVDNPDGTASLDGSRVV